MKIIVIGEMFHYRSQCLKKKMNTYLEERGEDVRVGVDEQDKCEESGEASIPDGWTHSGQRHFGTSCNL